MEEAEEEAVVVAAAAVPAVAAAAAAAATATATPKAAVVVIAKAEVVGRHEGKQQLNIPIATNWLTLLQQLGGIHQQRFRLVSFIWWRIILRWRSQSSVSRRDSVAEWNRTFFAASCHALPWTSAV